MCDGSRSGMPDDVDKNLRLQNALDTVRRRRPAGRPSRNGTVLAALTRGQWRAGAWGVSRSRTSVGIPDGGGRSRHSPPRGNGAVAPSIASANEQLLQQRNEAERPGCTHVVNAHGGTSGPPAANVGNGLFEEGQSCASIDRFGVKLVRPHVQAR